MPTIIGRISAFLWGIRVIEYGRDHFDMKTQYIFVGNHRSFIDAIISGGFIYNYKKFIGKAEILKWPFMGFILRKLYIPVKREDKDSRKKSMEQLIEKMKEGYSMVVFSEGKSNTTDEPLLPFKDGAYSTSCETKITIVPFVMYGADDLWPRKQLLIRPGKIYLDFLPPVLPLDSTEENIQIQKETVYNQMLETYLKHANKV
jgi:1-acyl-sn-glycerol-3-phosphate acyltransferase